ncbi:MAG: FMN-binding negative transcriptional regulator [Rubrivivax sp.]
MYLPRHFEQNDPAALAALMRAQPLATLVTPDADGYTADHIPLEYDAAARTLRGHVARPNPLWQRADGAAVLALFHGPQGYVSPGWYPSKAETHEVVPTWNYAVVHAHGRLRARDDPAWLHALLLRLTAQHEAGRLPPWQVSDAPPEYLRQRLRGIVGIEIAVERLVGKWKLSQNRSDADRRGVAAGLGDSALAALMRP